MIKLDGTRIDNHLLWRSLCSHYYEKMPYDLFSCGIIRLDESNREIRSVIYKFILANTAQFTRFDDRLNTIIGELASRVNQMIHMQDSRRYAFSAPSCRETLFTGVDYNTMITVDDSLKDNVQFIHTTHEHLIFRDDRPGFLKRLKGYQELALSQKIQVNMAITTFLEKSGSPKSLDSTWLKKSLQQIMHPKLRRNCPDKAFISNRLVAFLKVEKKSSYPKYTEDCFL